jgi:hypothetical protein
MLLGWEPSTITAKEVWSYDDEDNDNDDNDENSQATKNVGSNSSVAYFIPTDIAGFHMNFDESSKTCRLSYLFIFIIHQWYNLLFSPFLLVVYLLTTM